MNSTTQLFALNPFYQCDIYPRVCLAKGGVAPHCCKKKCVNVITDSLNCGSCGKKCKSGEACCKGRCVDVSTSRSNCGLCGMKCRYNPRVSMRASFQVAKLSPVKGGIP
ncbi:putative stigma-specific protein Stig1 [Helianthus annuus]|nr:putative stigma-specific protein Stig1 [Helianthus annuus]KAJ0523890.1 putative stigma-specific protein Stig1 [Helianthus annuus]